VAGAVQANRAWLTNLGWEVDGDALAKVVGAPVELVNDLVATALGLARLDPGELLDLNPGDAAPGGNAVLLGAGTGLGMALLVRSGERVMPVPSEGGHIELAAHDEEQWRLRQFLAERFGGRVSVERVVSGTGLRNLYDFLLADGVTPAAEVVRRLADGEDAGRVIGEAGLAGSCPACVRALDLFAACFGAIAGDMALVMVARGGVVLGGGVSLRLADKLTDGSFRRAFLDKGRLSYFVEKLPVRLILRPDVGLWGAARRAAELAG
jgi:glucokinase